MAWTTTTGHMEDSDRVFVDRLTADGPLHIGFGRDRFVADVRMCGQPHTLIDLLRDALAQCQSIIDTNKNTQETDR